MAIPALHSLSQALGYTFKNTRLLEQALTHRSLKAKHNERLEFLGDAVLGMIITAALFQRNPTASEGELSYMRAALVCEQALVSIAQKFQLADYIRVGPSELGQYKKRPALLADVLEALIGAIYLDAEWSSCEVCILGWYECDLDRVKYVRLVKDSKTVLQEYLQARGLLLPSYQLINQTGSLHEPIFTIVCKLPNMMSVPETACIGMGKNRRAAEQQAAAKVLTLLQHHDHAGHVSPHCDK
jgi:ribonuclease-3